MTKSEEKFEQADEIYSDQLVYKSKLHVLVERGTIKMLCGGKPKRKTLSQFLHELMPSTYSEEVVLGLDGTDYSQLPKLDEPFTFADQHYELDYDDVDEICMESEDDLLDEWWEEF